MRTLLPVLLLVLLARVHGAGAQPPSPQGWTHVRGLTGTARLLIAEAQAKSGIVAQLMRTIETTDVVVYVSDAETLGGEAEQPSAWLRFVSKAAGIRYLMVRVSRWLTPPWIRIAELGHELQHAVEVASAPEVCDEASLARLYRRIGREGVNGRFESQAAVSIGNQVLKRLRFRR